MKPPDKPRRVVVLGSTGTLGVKALDIICNFPDRFELLGISANRNITLVKKQIRKYKPRLVCVGGAGAAASLEKWMDGSGVCVCSGAAGLARLAADNDADAVFNGVSGISGLAPTLAALENGTQVLTANKESLVAGGDLIQKTARKSGAKIIPVDSEHSAVFQCLQGRRKDEVSRIVLTASGGPFLHRKNLKNITPAKALVHPNWSMGAKVTIDSATMMNKGLELLEAACLFAVPGERLGVVVHPESIVHAIVELVDGNAVSLMGEPDMRLPIMYALSYPCRLPAGAGREFRSESIGSLTFLEPDTVKFPCLALARAAMRMGGDAGAVLSAADEVAVDAFIKEKIGFSDIYTVVETALENAADKSGKLDSLDEIMDADARGRRAAQTAVKEIATK